MTTTPHGLARRSVGPVTLWLFGVSASAPMTVLAGGVVATYAATGVIAVPLSFILLTGVLLLFSIGFAALVARAPHAATFAALLTTGLGREAGVAGAAVALLAYNAIQIGLYGLLGATATTLLGGVWWAWALLAWAAVATLGILDIALGARLIATVLSAELTIIAILDIIGFTSPADPRPAAILAPLRPDLFLVDGIGGVLAFGIAAFIGFEAVAAFSEETRTPTTVRRALTTTLVFLGALYTLSSWAVALAVGPLQIADTARDPASGIPFSLLAGLGTLGPALATAGVTLLGLSILGAMISFHNVVARYLYALGREGVLPHQLATTGRTGRTRRGRGGTPTAGSRTQTVIALAGIVAFAWSGADPLTVMFTWLSTLSAIGIMALMTAASVAAITTHHAGRRRGILSRYGGEVPWADRWRQTLAPAGAAVSMLAVLTITVTNLDSTTGDPTSTAPWLLTGLVAATALAGAGWARWLRTHRPGVWTSIGRGQPRPLAVRDHLGLDL